jgi:putative flippase GtrA
MTGVDDPHNEPSANNKAEPAPLAADAGRGIGWIKSLFELELVRFGLIGVVNTAFGYGLFIILQLTLGQVTHYLVVLTVTNMIAVVQAYALQRWLVFRYKGNWWAGLLRFGAVYLVAFGFNLAFLPVLVEVANLPVIPAQGVALAIQVIGTYAAHKLFTFRQWPTLSPQTEATKPVASGEPHSE